MNKDDLRAEMEQKMPLAMFNDYARRQQLADNTKETKFLVNERLHKLERGLAQCPLRVEVFTQMDQKVHNDIFEKVSNDLQQITETFSDFMNSSDKKFETTF